MRILVVTPWVPYPVTGADQQDRFFGFKQLQKLGHEVHVLAKVHAFQNVDEIQRFYKSEGIPLTLVPYASSIPALLFQKFFVALAEPAFFDGSALEYIDPATVSAIDQLADSFKPDTAWVEFSFLWPVVRQLHRKGIPSVMRSANNEAQQSIDEHGGSVIKKILAVPKFRGERIAARESDALLAITPWEQQWYKKCGAKNVDVLPLRGLPETFQARTHQKKDVLDVVFLSSSYTNGHNRDALKFLLTSIIPEVMSRSPNAFRFHITGKKFPEEFRKFLKPNTEVHGFIPDLAAFLKTMDIALCPSVSGQGMQQKIFEPLCCGLPLITHHTAGYPFGNDSDVLFAKTGSEFAEALEKLRSHDERQRISLNAYKKAEELFSEKAILAITQKALSSVS